LIDYLPALRKMLKIHLLQVHGKGDIKRFGTLVDVNAEVNFYPQAPKNPFIIIIFFFLGIVV